MNHGVYVSQLATSVSTPVVAESGIPFVVGLAPVQVADKPAAAGTPVLCTSWAEAVEKLGYSDDWGYLHAPANSCIRTSNCSHASLSSSATSSTSAPQRKRLLPLTWR